MKDWYRRRKYQTTILGGSIALGVAAMFLASFLISPTSLLRDLVIIAVFASVTGGSFYLLGRVFAQQLNQEFEALVQYYEDVE